MTQGATLVAIVATMQDTKKLIVAEHAERLALAVYRLTAIFLPRSASALQSRCVVPPSPSDPTSRKVAGAAAIVSC
jgi:hypothetical protein